MAMRRTSWIDHRINDGVAMVWLLPWFGVCFFWRRRIGAMADHRHHGEGEHHHGNVAMPAMPGSALVVVEPELVLGGLKTVLGCPPMAFDLHKCFDRSCRWAPGGDEGEIAIGRYDDGSADRVSKLFPRAFRCLRDGDLFERESRLASAARK